MDEERFEVATCDRGGVQREDAGGPAQADGRYKLMKEVGVDVKATRRKIG